MGAESQLYIFNIGQSLVYTCMAMFKFSVSFQTIESFRLYSMRLIAKSCGSFWIEHLRFALSLVRLLRDIFLSF